MRGDALTDLRSFLGRVNRLDPGALVRIQPIDATHRDRSRRDQPLSRLWSMLPFGVLATRVVPVAVDTDITVRGADLWNRLDVLAAEHRVDASQPLTDTLPRHDGQWRGVLPPPDAAVIERLDAADCQRIGRESATALQEAQQRAQLDNRAVGQRRLRDTLLDHTALTVTVDDRRHDVSVRLVIGLLRMGFAPDGTVLVRRAGGRIGLGGRHGAAWSTGGGLPLLT